MTDSVTGAPAAAGVTGVVWNEYSTFSLEEDFGVLSAQSTTLTAWATVGTYRVRLEKAGYQPWTVNGIRVQKDGCERLVRTVHLDARLQPLQ